MVKVEIITEPMVNISIGESIIHTGDYDYYEGPYQVTPTVSEQTLLTAEKVLEHNVTVEQIPYQATTNPQGGTTISIAS